MRTQSSRPEHCPDALNLGRLSSDAIQRRVTVQKLSQFTHTLSMHKAVGCPDQVGAPVLGGRASGADAPKCFFQFKDMVRPPDKRAGARRRASSSWPRRRPLAVNDHWRPGPVTATESPPRTFSGLVGPAQTEGLGRPLSLVWVCKGPHARWAPVRTVQVHGRQGRNSWLTQRGDQALGVKDGFVFEHVIDGAGQLDGQDGVGLELVTVHAGQ